MGTATATTVIVTSRVGDKNGSSSCSPVFVSFCAGGVFGDVEFVSGDGGKGCVRLVSFQ